MPYITTNMSAKSKTSKRKTTSSAIPVSDGEIEDPQAGEKKVKHPPVTDKDVKQDVKQDEKKAAVIPLLVEEPTISEYLKKEPPGSGGWAALRHLATYYTQTDVRDYHRQVVRKALRPVDTDVESGSQPGIESKDTIDFTDKKARETLFPDITIASSDGTTHHFHKHILASAKYASAVWSAGLADDKASSEIKVNHGAETTNIMLNWLYRLPRKRTEWFVAELTRRFDRQNMTDFLDFLVKLGLAAFAYDIADLQFEVNRVLTILVVDVGLDNVRCILEFFERTKINTEPLAEIWKQTWPSTDSSPYGAATWKFNLTPTFAKQCLTQQSVQKLKIGRLLFHCFEQLPKDDATLAVVAQNAARAFNLRKPYGATAGDKSLNAWLTYAKDKAVPGFHRFTYHLSVALTG